MLPSCRVDDVSLFHYTGKDNLPSIARKGLLVNFSDYLEEDPEDVLTDEDYNEDWMDRPVVWAGDKELIFDTLGAGNDPKKVIIGIKQPCAAHFSQTNYKDWFSIEPVPPRCLCLVDPSSYPRHRGDE